MAYTSLSNVGNMTTNSLDPVRGWWDERQLSRVCQVATANVTAGMVGYLDGNNRFEKGAPTTIANAMPLFARGGDADNDAIRYQGNFAAQNSVAASGGSNGADTELLGNAVGISCLVGTGAYELGTTAFTAGSGGTAIIPGVLLMADGTTGKIKRHANVAGAYGNATAPATDGRQVVGISTSTAASSKNQYNVGMVYFYVNWWPAI